MISGSLGTSISAFLSWWAQELYGLVPGRATLAEPKATRTIVAVAPGGLRLIETADGKPRNKDDPRPDGVIPVSAMLAYLSSRSFTSRSRQPIGLRLPYSLCFVRRLELPVAAQRNFPRLLAMDLERTTPFKLTDVLTAHDVDASPNPKGLLKIRQFIVKRELVEPLKAQIEASGLKVTRVDCTTESGAGALPVNFLAQHVTPDPSSPRVSRLVPFLAMAAMALVATGISLYIDRHEQALQSLESQTAKLKAKAQIQKDALAKTQAAFVEIANYQKLRAETVSRVAMLEELTRILPDTAWVTDAKFDGSTIDIIGSAVSAAALVPILERSKIFVDATSMASVTFDARDERERFAIRARNRTPGITNQDQAKVQGAGP